MSQEDEVLGNLVQAVDLLENSPSFANAMPEIRTNIAYAMPFAREKPKVAAIKGRITIIDGKAKACGYPSFGASSHLARLVVTLMEKDPNKRAAINLKYEKEMENFLDDYCSLKSLLRVTIDRSKEPWEYRLVEDSSMEWVAAEMVRKAYGKVPDIVCTFGAEGKEAVTVIVGKSALEVAKRAVDISQFVKQNKLKKAQQKKLEEEKENLPVGKDTLGKEESAPVESAPVEPAPVEPAPVEPAPVKDVPEEKAPEPIDQPLPIEKLPLGEEKSSEEKESPEPVEKPSEKKPSEKTEEKKTDKPSPEELKKILKKDDSDDSFWGGEQTSLEKMRKEDTSSFWDKTEKKTEETKETVTQKPKEDDDLGEFSYEKKTKKEKPKEPEKESNGSDFEW